MLFITYWELSGDVQTSDILDAGEVLMDEGLWPPEDLEIIRWDVTADEWGVTIAEADEYEPVRNAMLMWEELVPGMFATTKTAPATPSEEAMMEAGALIETLPDRH